MPKVKEISGASFGTITITSKNNEFLYSLTDLCKLFGINYQDTRVEIRNDNIHEIQVDKASKKTKKLFVSA